MHPAIIKIVEVVSPIVINEVAEELGKKKSKKIDKKATTKKTSAITAFIGATAYLLSAFDVIDPALALAINTALGF